MAREGHTLLEYRWCRWWTGLGDALRREGRSLWACLGDPAFAGLALGALLLVALACQVAAPFALDVGRRPEEVYLEGFHDVEQGAGWTYRWSTAEARLRVPGLGQAPHRLQLVLAAPRPTGHPLPHLRLEAGGQVLLDTQAGIEPRLYVYSVVLPGQALAGGTLDLRLYSDTFVPANDPRTLGLMLNRAEVRPVGAAPLLPPLDVLLWSLLAVVLVVLLSRRLGWPRPVAFLVGGVFALVLAAALAWARPLLVPGLPFLAAGVAGAWLATVLARGAVGSLFSRAGAALSPGTERALWSVVAFFLAVRLAGLFHPAFETFDLCFHFHRLQQVTRGEVLFTIVSGEWRSQTTFYLPSLYVLLAPFWALFGGRLVPFKVAALLLDVGAALWVGYIGRRLLGRGVASPLAAFLYLTMPQSYLIFSWGIVANMLGQWFLLAVVALLVSPAGRLIRRRSRLAVAGLLLPALLSHPGTVQLTAALLVGFLATVWVAPPSQFFSRPALWRWAGVGLLAVLLSVLLYYSYFAGTMWASLQDMQAGANAEQPASGGILVRGPVIDPELGLVPVEVATRGEALVAGVRELASEAQAYYHTGPMVLALAALVGLALERRALTVRLVGLAFVVALFFAVVGLAFNLYVRYMYFLLPFVALGAAWWLSRLLRKGWAGRAAAVLAGLYLLSMGLVFWVDHVLYYSAGCR